MVSGVVVAIMILGLVPAAIAGRKGHSFLLYWFYGVLFLPLALAAAILVERLKQCPYCRETIKREALLCPHCRQPQPDGPAERFSLLKAPTPVTGKRPGQPGGEAGPIGAGAGERLTALSRLGRPEPEMAVTAVVAMGLIVAGTLALWAWPGSSLDRDEVFAEHADPAPMTPEAGALRFSAKREAGDAADDEKPSSSNPPVDGPLSDGAESRRAAGLAGGTASAVSSPVSGAAVAPIVSPAAAATDAELERLLPSVSKIRSRRQLVERIQEALLELGFAPGKPDGIMGPQTRAAVRAFQQQVGLPANGYVNHRLLAEALAALERRAGSGQEQVAGSGLAHRREAAGRAAVPWPPTAPLAPGEEGNGPINLLPTASAQ